MKQICFLIIAILCGAIAFAETPAPTINWNLLWAGSWEESASTPLSGNLHNRGETTLHYLPFGILLRGQVLDRRPFNLEIDSLWSNSEKWVTNYNAGIYHRPTSSRLLFGVIEEAGLPARIRNPWIRSPPYTENHKNTIADLRTTVSSTREDEAYLYLASPFLEIHPNIMLKGFFSVQTEIENLTPALSIGTDFKFPKNTRLLAEAFYTEKTLAPTKINAWFSDTPPLPEREFRLYAAGLLFKNANFSVSSDFALSETFAWGTDIYANFGITVTPPLFLGSSFARSRTRPLAISLAADGSGQQFVNRDGVNCAEGYRNAAKIEWRGKYNSFLKLDTVLRGPGFGEDFNRSSTGFYCRFPAGRESGIIQLSTISLSADRNAVNPQKINDSFSGAIGLNIYLGQIGLKSPIRINISGSIKELAASEGAPSPFPIPEETWNWYSTSASCEFMWSYGKYQYRSKTGYTYIVEKDEIWDFSLSVSARTKQGRLTIKAASPDFPDKWLWSASWRMEIHGKS